MTTVETRTARDRYLAFIDRHEVAWELFFAALAVVFVALAFVPVVPGSGEEASLEALEWVITGIFAIEYGTRLWASYDRRAYARRHWIDLISLIPPTRWLRPFRLLRLLRLLRTFAGIGRAMEHVNRVTKHTGFIWLILAWLAVMLLCSVALYAAENGINAAVTSPLDALWWGITTMTTVGYGDIYPITAEGKIAAAVLMILGIGIYSAITATIASSLISTSPARSSMADELDRLADLHRRGDLSDDEFETAKTVVLRGSGEPVSAAG